MFNKNRKYFVLSIVFVSLSVLINAFIIYQSCLKGSSSSSWSDNVTKTAADVINTIAPNTITEKNMPDFSSFIRKAIGHYGLFGINGIVTTLAIYFSISYTSFYKHHWGIAISGSFGLLIASLTEIIQSFVPGRSGQITDVIIDFAGFFTSVAIVYLIIILALDHKKKAPEAEANS